MTRLRTTLLAATAAVAAVLPTVQAFAFDPSAEYSLATEPTPTPGPILGVVPVRMPAMHEAQSAGRVRAGIDGYPIDPSAGYQTTTNWETPLLARHA